ncbi:MAG: trans-aconitate 2-methyltransferase [Actinomycetota bacterium]|nr:trans-aconitate 2-methyltransferase [Actinomycetota bacterium]
MTSYTFGDDAIASERLGIVAELMEPYARALLARVDAGAVRDVLDLGCGPGHTTRMLATVFPGANVVGVDQSTAFVETATASAPASCRFVVADVGSETLPGAPADVVYARYLLSHLADAGSFVTRWCTALKPCGWLVLEEPESIESCDPDFAAYERIAASLVQSTGALFYAGTSIATLPTPRNVERVHDETVVIDLTAGQAASMFWRNARAWDRDALARAGHDQAGVQQLAERLRARENDPTRGLFDWRQRQTLFRALPPDR